MIRKSAFFYTFIFLFIFVSTYVLCDIASNQHELEFLSTSVNLFSIVAAEDPGRSGTYISEAEYGSLDSLIDKLSMCCHAFSHTGITAMRKMHNAKIIFTDYRYAGMNGMRFAYGNYFTEGNQAHGDLKAVIDRKASWELFGTTGDVTGLAVEIFGMEFEIIGVSEQDTGFIRIPDDEICVYVPISLLEISGEKTGVTGILVNFPEDVSSYVGKERIAGALQSIGKNPDGYRIKSVRRTAAMVRMICDLFVCIMAAISAAILVGRLYTQIRSSLEEFRNDLAVSGFKTALKVAITVRRILLPVVYTLLIVSIYLLVRSRVRMILEFLDKEPVTGSLAGVFSDSFLQAVNKGGGTQPAYDILLFCSACAFLAGILVGLPVLLTGMGFLKKLTDDRYTLLTCSGIAILLIILIVIASCALAGLDPLVRISSVFVIWVFFAVIISDSDIHYRSNGSSYNRIY